MLSHPPDGPVVVRQRSRRIRRVLLPRLGDRHPGLALDHGLAVYRASLRWTRHTIAALRADPVPPQGGALTVATEAG